MAHHENLHADISGVIFDIRGGENSLKGILKNYVYIKEIKSQLTIDAHFGGGHNKRTVRCQPLHGESLRTCPTVLESSNVLIIIILYTVE